MAAYQAFGSSSNQQNRKRTRMNEEEEQLDNPKRYFDLNTTFSPVIVPAEKNLPAITYASPDYRPPPPAETPLWLQPMTTHSPMTEDDSEDELLTPSLQQHQSSSNKSNQQGAPTTEYWGDMMVDQWQ